MKFSVLSSGSKANATVIEMGGMCISKKRILIDCGLSGRAVAERMIALGISPDSIDAILVTHEHSDHIRGVATLSKRFRIPVYVNEKTARFLGPCYGVEHFTTGESFSIGDAKVFPFSIAHDAVDPVGFVIEAEGFRFGQATDLGRVTSLVRVALSGCHAVVLEANHDEDMLHSCSYPWELKQRIQSSHGHLSNASSGSLIQEIMHSELRSIVLGHLSEESNTPSCALGTVRSFLKDLAPRDLVCGSIAQPTPLFDLAA